MKFEINISTLASDINTLTSYKSALKDRVEGLSNGMDSLNSTWEGSAKQAYMTVYEADETCIRDLLTALDEFIQTLEYARSEYQTCENSVNNAVKALKI